MSMYDDVKRFHVKYELTYEGPPRGLEEDLHNFRRKFIAEELVEYNSARVSGQLDEQLDALVDLMYVVLGTAYLHGFSREIFEEAWRRVHEANMRKIKALAAEDSKRGFKYDVVKPEGWVKPNLKDLVGR